MMCDVVFMDCCGEVGVGVFGYFWCFVVNFCGKCIFEFYE